MRVLILLLAMLVSGCVEDAWGGIRPLATNRATASRGGGGGGGSYPDCIAQSASLIGQYRASTSTVYTDTGCTTAVASNGDNVKCMTDASSEGNDLTENTRFPHWRTNCMNGHSCIDFTRAGFGNSDRLNITQGRYNPKKTAPVTVMIAAMEETNSDGSLFYGNGEAYDQFHTAGGLSGGGSFSIDAGTTLTTADGAHTDGEIFILTVEYNDANSQIWLNGVEDSNSPGDTGTLSSDDWRLGASGSGGTGWEGGVIDLLIWDAELSSTDRANTEDCINQYGITLP